MTGYIATRGPALVEKGYAVAAIAAGGKGAVYKDWQSRSLTASECAAWDPAAGVGILCGMDENPVCAVDVDILDEVFAEHMADVLRGLGLEGAMWRRTGRPPKFLVPFRAAQAGWRKAVTPEYVKDGVKAQVEILGKGQQFVAFHTHPDTGKPYAWSPLSGAWKVFPRYEELPLITLEQVEAVMRAFEDYAEAHGYERGQGGTGVGIADAPLVQALTPPTPPVEGLEVGRMRTILDELISHKALDLGAGTHDAWVRLGMALHHQTQGAPEGLALWDEMSARFPDAYAEGACAARWRTFDSTRPGGVTFRTYMAEHRRRVVGDAYQVNEIGLLHRVVGALGDRAVYLPEIAAWVFYDDEAGRWERTRGYASVAGVVRDVFTHGLTEEIKNEPDEDRRKELTKLRSRCVHAARTSEGNIMSLLKGTSALVGTLDEFDERPYLLGVGNGVLDVRDRSLVPNRASLRVMRQAGAVYDPDAKCPVWAQCMLDWLDDDAEKVAYVQRLLGQALTGAPTEDVFLMLRGIGCNGKSVFLNTIAAVFGGYAEAIGENTLMGYANMGEGGRARADLVKLRGARFVYCSETSAGLRLKEADVKRMTGRDSIAARAPYGREEIVIRPSWLLCIGTNHVPEVKGDDEGIWRRIADVEFPRNFMKDKRTKMDPYLSEKLGRELSGILNWILDGYDEYLRIGVCMPESVVKATQAYREEMDDVKSWATQRVRPTERTGSSPLQLFYSDFVLWSKAQGIRDIISQAAFTRRFKRYVTLEYGDNKAVFRSCSVQKVRRFELTPPGAEDFEDIDEEEDENAFEDLIADFV